MGSPNLTGRRRCARKSTSDPRKRGHSRERPSSRRVLGHRCRHNADASLRFRVTGTLAKGRHPARVMSTRSLVRQLARSACREILPRRRRCVVVFVGRRGPINHPPGERRSFFGRRRSLSTKLDRTGNRTAFIFERQCLSIPCATRDKRRSATTSEAPCFRAAMLSSSNAFEQQCFQPACVGRPPLQIARFSERAAQRTSRR